MAFSKKIRQAVWGMYGKNCAYCGEPINYKEMQVDHFIPKERFHMFARKLNYSVDDFVNLKPSCQKCNNFKNVWLIEEWRTELEKQVKRGRAKSINFRFAEKFGLIKVTDNPVKFHFESFNGNERPVETCQNQKKLNNFREGMKC